MLVVIRKNKKHIIMKNIQQKNLQALSRDSLVNN